MESSDKSLYLCLVGIALVVVGFVATIRLANTIPHRPRRVDRSAVFLWAPAVGFPGLPRRGWWFSCSEQRGHDFCKLSSLDGNTEYEGEFVRYGDKGFVPANQLQIIPEKTAETETKIWMGHILVPIVFLRSGDVLIPKDEYGEGVRLVEGLAPAPKDSRK